MIELFRAVRAALRHEAELPTVAVRFYGSDRSTVGIGVTRARLASDQDGRPRIVSVAPIDMVATRACHVTRWETDFSGPPRRFEAFPHGVWMACGDHLHLDLTLEPLHA